MAKKPYKSRLCVVCGTRFTPHAPNGKVCSDKCREAYKREAQRRFGKAALEGRRKPKAATKKILEPWRDWPEACFANPYPINVRFVNDS